MLVPAVRGRGGVLQGVALTGRYLKKNTTGVSSMFHDFQTQAV